MNELYLHLLYDILSRLAIKVGKSLLDFLHADIQDWVGGCHQVRGRSNNTPLLDIVGPQECGQCSRCNVFQIVAEGHLMLR